jgi:hypothetical protein
VFIAVTVAIGDEAGLAATGAEAEGVSEQAQKVVAINAKNAM